MGKGHMEIGTIASMSALSCVCLWENDNCSRFGIAMCICVNVVMIIIEYAATGCFV